MSTLTSRLLPWLNLGSKDSLRSHLIKGAIGSFILKSCGLLLQLTAGIFIARSLGASGYGTYAYALAIINLLTIPTVMGLPQLITRNVAIYHVKNEFGLMRGLLVRSNQAVFILSLIMAFIALFISLTIINGSDKIRLQTFLISLILLPILALKNLRMAALRGLKHVVLSLMPETLFRPGFFIIFLLMGIVFLPSGMSPQKVMIFQVSAASIAFFLGVVFLLRALPENTKTTVSQFETRTWLKSAIPFMFLGAMQIVNKQTDIVMLGIFRSIEQVGIYRAVVQGATLVAFVLTAVNVVLLPTVAGLHAKGDKKRLQRIVTYSARAILAATFPIILVFVFWGRWLLVTFFGQEFGDGTTALSILCIGQLVNASMGSVALILNMTGHERDAARGVAIAAVLNIFINALLIPKFGMEGAAAASTISLITWNVFMFFWVYKRIGVVSIAFGVNLILGRNKAKT